MLCTRFSNKETLIAVCSVYHKEVDFTSAPECEVAVHSLLLFVLLGLQIGDGIE